MIDEQTLKRNIYYWAHQYKCAQVEFDELVQFGYELILSKNITNPKLLKDWLKYEMMRHVIRIKQERSCCFDDMSYYDKEKDIYEHLNIDKIHDAVANSMLSDRERHVINQHYFNRITKAEISRRLNISKQTIDIYIQRALRKIKKYMESKE